MEQHTMFRLTAVRVSAQRQYFHRVWTTPKKLSDVIQASLTNFNHYYGTDYTIEEVIVERE